MAHLYHPIKTLRMDHLLGARLRCTKRWRRGEAKELIFIEPWTDPHGLISELFAE